MKAVCSHAEGKLITWRGTKWTKQKQECGPQRLGKDADSEVLRPASGFTFFLQVISFSHFPQLQLLRISGLWCLLIIERVPKDAQTYWLTILCLGKRVKMKENLCLIWGHVGNGDLSFFSQEEGGHGWGIVNSSVCLHPVWLSGEGIIGSWFTILPQLLPS